MYKQLNKKFKTETARVEFWAVTSCILLMMGINIFDNARNNNDPLLSNSLIPVLFSYALTFISYLLLCFYVAPSFEGDDDELSNGVLFVLVFIGLCFLLGIANIYLSVLLSIKILLLFFNRNRNNKANELNHEAALLTASWILVTMGLMYTSITLRLKFYVSFDLPSAIVLYLYSVHVLLPRVNVKNKGVWYYLSIMFLLSIFSCIVVYITCSCFTGNKVLVIPNNALSIYIEQSDIAGVVFQNLVTQLLIVTPLARYIYNGRNLKKDEEIKTLKTELGKSDASLNFLKSQINPHFLFNALNTLYGTALQENAERTGEGIQKLGDMMRFMLQENMQDKIPLSRDVEYLKNYILLQKLRTSTSEDIVIEAQIEEADSKLIIAPMLLIPFVENAFKHGISLLNLSHIKITLQTSGSTLYFDVHNSIHIRNEHDPEKGKSGIGLQNVKQRLVLLYPERHDLIIRENAKEFFIHLTLQLDIIN